MIGVRIGLNIVALLSFFFLPWWATFLIVLMLSWRFAPLYEAVVYGVIFDALYGVAAALPFSFHFPFTLFFTVIVFISLYVRDRVRIHV